MIYRVILCVLLFSPWEVLAQISVNFQAQATVSGPRILLGDIAVIRWAGDRTEAIARLPIASSPAPGKSKELYTVSVINALRNRKEVAGVDWQGSLTIVVERQGTRISPQQIQAILGQYLKENSDKLPKADIRLTLLRAPEELVVPAGTLSWSVSPSRPGILGSSTFSIAFAVNGEPAGNRVVRCRLAALGEVAVAAIPLHRGQLISPRCVRLEKKDLGDLNDPFTTTDQVVGMEMARTVSAGTVLDDTNVAAPALIKAGDMVKIVARKGALQITTSGLAQENGPRGAMIRVKNISTNKLLHCRVEGPGVVSVEF